MTRALLSAVAAALILTACSGQPHLFGPVPGEGGPGGNGLRATLLRSASGAPSGVRVSWEKVDNTDVAGYNLYRDSVPLADDEVGQSAHRVNATPIVPTGNPDTISYDDLFATNAGDSWYYRVSTVDSDGDESDLSPEGTITISDFVVTKLVTTQAGVGDTVEIDGQNFGSADPNDFVEFPGVVFAPGGGFSPTLIKTTILEHEINRIRCAVPAGATTGKVRVTIHGLSQDTPETFFNTDPYVEDMTPVSGNTDDLVTVTGHNFGATHDSAHRLFLEGNALPDAQYVRYSDTRIEFKPIASGAGSFSSALPVNVHVGTKTSNGASFSLIDRPPLAVLQANPLDGQTPMLVDFDASGSADPDKGDSVSFSWDFDGDGNIDFDSGPDPTVSHTYDKSGDFTCRVYVIDLSAANSTATAAIHVTASAMTLSDNGTFAPGSQYTEADQFVTISYDLEGGEPARQIEWYLADAVGGNTLIATDNDVAPGTGFHSFPIDSRTTRPVPGSGNIPAGTWSIFAKTADGAVANDPDPTKSWPFFADGSAGFFTVYRYRVLFVQDAEGDSNGSETAALRNKLDKLSYKTGVKSSKTVRLTDMQTADAVVWAADGPHGAPGLPPFDGWLDATDLALMRQYLDGGGNLILFGPPSGPGVSMADNNFKDNYQPFQNFQPQPSSPFGLNLHSYAATGTYVLDTYDTGSGWGDDGGTSLQGSSTSEADFVDSNGVPDHSMASRQTPGGGTCFFGMVVFSAISTTRPPGTSPDQLLDNIVAGAIKN